MTKQFFALALLATSFYYAQEGRVGVNTTAPKTTMDINGKTNASGVSLATDMTGLQAPRLTRAELTAKGTIYGTDQKGALVYITNTDAGNGNADPSSPRKNVTSIGYYYFDGTEWVKIISGSGSGTTSVTANNGLNMSTASNVQLGGVLEKNTDISLSNFKLNFTETATGNGSVLVGTELPTGTLGVNTPKSILRLDVDGMTRTDMLTVGGASGIGAANATAHIRNDQTSTITEDATNSSRALLVLTGYNNTTSPVLNSGLPLRKMHVANDGKVGIAGPGQFITITTGHESLPTQALDVDGNVRFRGVPSGTETTGDKMMVLAADGTAKLLPLPSPSTSTIVSPVITTSSTIPTSYDVILLDIGTPGQVITLPTSGISVGKTVFISQKGNATVNIKPDMRENTHLNLDAGSAGVYVYIGGTGAGSWIRASGY